MVVLTLEYIKHITGEFDAQSVFQVILSNKAISRIDALSQCCNLRWLDLSRNQIIRIENLEGLSQLVSLNMSFNKIPKITGLETLQNLERLQLRSNTVSRLQDLEGLKEAPKLRHLQLQNIDVTEFCPVCLQPGYKDRVRALCPDLVALDSRRFHLPDLDKEMERIERQSESALPEPEPWFPRGCSELDIEGLLDAEVIDVSLRPSVQAYEAALAECQNVLKEADELLRLQDMAPTE